LIPMPRPPRRKASGAGALPPVRCWSPSSHRSWARWPTARGGGW